MSLPTDMWMPVSKKLKPLVSDQVSVGAYYNLHKNYSFSVEGYHKWMNHLLDYKDGYNFLPSFVGWEEKLAAGKGWAYGAEFIARKETGRITGWIGYGLMWSDRQFDEINNGKRFPAKYDNRHKLNIVANWKINEKLELTGAGLSWNRKPGYGGIEITRIWASLLSLRSYRKEAWTISRSVITYVSPLTTA